MGQSLGRKKDVVSQGHQGSWMKVFVGNSESKSCFKYRGFEEEQGQHPSGSADQLKTSHVTQSLTSVSCPMLAEGGKMAWLASHPSCGHTEPSAWALLTHRAGPQFGDQWETTPSVLPQHSIPGLLKDTGQAHKNNESHELGSVQSLCTKALS